MIHWNGLTEIDEPEELKDLRLGDHFIFILSKAEAGLDDKVKEEKEHEADKKAHRMR